MSTIGTFLQLALFLIIIGGIIYGILLGNKVLDKGLTQAKEELGKKGVNLTANGLAVKTNKRAMTREESEDQLQAGIMRGWKATSFQVPWLLQKASNLSGSSHDKGKAEYELKHGIKKSHVA